MTYPNSASSTPSDDATRPAHTDALDDDAPASVAEMLAISEEQARHIDHLNRKPTTAIVFIWGVAWFVGFLLLWSGTGANPLFQTPTAFSNITFGVLIGGAAIASAIIGARSGRGVQGPQVAQSAMYGISWAIGTTAAGIFGGGMLANGMAGDLPDVFFPAVYSLIVGILYLGGGALWHDRTMYAVGCWTIAVGVAAPFFGVPTNALVMALAGGGGFLIYGVLLVAFGHRMNPRALGKRV